MSWGREPSDPTGGLLRARFGHAAGLRTPSQAGPASFIVLGLARWRVGFSRWIGWIGIVAGIASILGLMPSLLILFLVANILYIVWYIGIGARFSKLAA